MLDKFDIDGTTAEQLVDIDTNDNSCEPAPVKTFMTHRTQQILKLVSMGMSIEEAYEICEPNKPLKSYTKRRLKKQLQDYTLKTTKFVKLAHKAIEDTLKMKEINGSAPTVTNRLVAANMVLERCEPVIKEQKTEVSITWLPVDLSKYLPKDRKSSPQLEHPDICNAQYTVTDVTTIEPMDSDRLANDVANVGNHAETLEEDDTRKRLTQSLLDQFKVNGGQAGG
jgi:hypothetical protein